MQLALVEGPFLACHSGVNPIKPSSIILCAPLLCVLVSSLGCDSSGSGLHKVKAVMVVSPDPVIFDSVPRGTTASRTLRIENDGQSRLAVENVVVERGADLGFALAASPSSLSLEPGGSREIQVLFSAESLDEVNGALLIRSNASDGEERRVELQATRREGPVLVVCVESVDVPLGTACGLPSEIDFGRVNLGETWGAKASLRSAGTDALQITSVHLDGHPSVAIDRPSLPIVIAPGDSIDVPVRYTASVSDPATATLSIESSDALNPEGHVLIRGVGAELGLCVRPEIVDFGSIRIGSSRERTVELSNCGTAALPINVVEVAPLEEFALSGASSGRAVTIEPQSGLTLDVGVRYRPIDEGRDEGRLRITTANGRSIVPMRGESETCKIAVLPESLTFVVDSANSNTARQSFLLENTGTSSCTIESAVIAEGIDAGFRFARVAPAVPGGEPPPPPTGANMAELQGLPIVVGSGASLEIVVSFSSEPLGAPLQGTQTGRVDIRIAERDDLIRVPLSATETVTLDPNCTLQISPSTLAYGVVRVGQRRILGVNLVSNSACAIASVSLPDDAGGVFHLGANPPTIVNRATTLFVEFQPTSRGAFNGALQIVTGASTPRTYRVDLHGAAGDSSLCVDPQELAFGQRTSVATMDFNLSACGTEVVTITALDWTEQDSEVSLANPPSLPLVLNVGQTQPITVKYDPQDGAGDTAVMRVTSSDTLHPETTVRATGGREIVPVAAGRFLYYWQIDVPSSSDIMRQPLQGDLTSTPYWGQRHGNGCAGCHQLSPDGRYLAVTQFESMGGGGGAGAVHVVDTETSALSAAPGASVEAFFLSWKPDVNTNPPYQYVYSRDGDLHLASLYTGYIGPLSGASDPMLNETMPSWGPDGQIAFVSAAPPTIPPGGPTPPGGPPPMPGRSGGPGGVGISGASEIRLVNESGGASVALQGASGNNAAHYYPRYSPNGSWIAYTLSASAVSTISASDAQIRLVRSNNSGSVLELPLLNAGASSYPTWSIDGRFLSFSSNRSGGKGGWDIYLAPMDPVSGQEGVAVNLSEANTSSFDHAAQWSP